MRKASIYQSEQVEGWFDYAYHDIRQAQRNVILIRHPERVEGWCFVL